MESAMKILSRDVIKYFAMLTMLLNHIANVFLTPGTLLYEFFLNIGYFTAVTMCYFLVEGYGYTHSRREYARRLLVFAGVSQIPYSMAFAGDSWIEFSGFNMIFTLFLCFLLICILEQEKVRTMRVLGITVIFMICVFCDWSVLAPAFTVLFVWAKDSERKKGVAFLTAMVLFGGMIFLGGIGRISIAMNLMYAVFGMLGVGLSGIVILYFYNGRRMEKGRKFSKWFFYWFYPVHLLVIGIVRTLI